MSDKPILREPWLNAKGFNTIEVKWLEFNPDISQVDGIYWVSDGNIVDIAKFMNNLFLGLNNGWIVPIYYAIVSIPNVLEVKSN